MALWGANDNLLSPGTVSLDYSSGTVTASVGASFGFVGYGGTGDVIRFGVKVVKEDMKITLETLLLLV